MQRSGRGGRGGGRGSWRSGGGAGGTGNNLNSGRSVVQQTVGMVRFFCSICHFLHAPSPLSMHLSGADTAVTLQGRPEYNNGGGAPGLPGLGPGGGVGARGVFQYIQGG